MESSGSANKRSSGFQIVNTEPVSEIAESKTCNLCGKMYTGNLTDYFAPRRNTPDGLRSQCRQCVNAKNRARRKTRNEFEIQDWVQDIFKDAAKEILLDNLSSNT